MKWIRAHCHVIDHPRFTDAGALARDLWQWGMLFSGKHETDGVLRMNDVLRSGWGYGDKRNVKLAEKLVDVGLWERTDAGYRISKWAEMGNPTKAELDEKRGEEREGRASRRKRTSSPPTESVPDARECPPRTHDSVPYSHSLSLEDRNDVGVLRRPAGAFTSSASEPLLEDAHKTWESRTFAEAPDDPLPAVWANFCGHYAGQEFLNREAFLGKWQKWIGNQIQRDKQARIARADRKQAFNQRAAGPPPPPKQTPEQSKKFAEELAARIAADRKGAA